jgi:PIN domain nuclease of toxin-antitoxin system
VSSTEVLLLDTHVWIWVMEGDRRRLDDNVAARIDAAAGAGGVWIHPLSIWEVGTLVRRGRLSLAGPVDQWVEEAISVRGVSLVPVTPAMALGAARLPDSFPGDPVDRMLVSAAYLLGATLVTCDRRILCYEGAEAPEVLRGHA